jgi:hypothetical protein
MDNLDYYLEIDRTSFEIDVQVITYIMIDTEIDRIICSFNQEKVFLFSMSNRGSRNFYNKLDR